MAGISESLEEIAAGIRMNAKPGKLQPTTVSLLEQEIAFASEQLERIRHLHTEQLRSITKSESYVSTDLMKLDFYLPQLFDFRFRARDNLKNKLLKLDMERRRLITLYEQQLAELRRKLLSLIGEHSHLKPENGHR